MTQMALLAEAAVGGVPVGIAAWLGCLAFVVMLVNGVLKLVDRTKLKPEPAATYATKLEIERHVQENHEEHQSIFSKIGGVERGLRQEIKTDTGELHEKVNKVDSIVSGLKTATDMQNQQLLRIEGKLDQMNRDTINDRKRH